MPDHNCMYDVVKLHGKKPFYRWQEQETPIFSVADRILVGTQSFGCNLALISDCRQVAMYYGKQWLREHFPFMPVKMPDQ